MKLKIDNNSVDVKNLAIIADGKISKEVALRNVRYTYQTDSDGNRTDTIKAILYDCVDPVNFATFTLKVNSSKAVITPEELEEAEDVVYIEIPVELTVIKPYSIEYGKAKVSIIAPNVKLLK